VTAARFEGRYIERDAPDFHASSVDPIFNARHPDRHPAAVLEAASEADVVAGVLLARERGWQVSVRAGGHSWAAWSLRDDALLIDLRGLREMHLDADRRIAIVSPAVQGGAEFAPFLRSHGLMFPGGHCSTVGLGGFLLQGGQGWNSRTWGWGCEQILAVDVVTADGDLVHATDEQHSDLLWAARGAGPGFFGVVTRFHLRVHPMPAAFTQSTFCWPLDCFDEVMSWAHEVLPTLDTRVEPVIVGTRLAPPGIDNGDEPVIIMHTTGLFDTPEEAAALLAPLQTCPVLDRALLHEHCVPTTFDIENVIMDGQNPPGKRYAADCAWTNASASELSPVLRDLYATLPTPESFCIWYGWSPKRPLPDMAFSMEGNVYVAAYTIWTDEADDEQMRDWVTERFVALEPLSVGQYLGDADLTRRPGKFMADANFSRLEALRDRYDPDRRFVGYLVKGGATPNASACTA
jgi:FAD/FMN-containing dehydrogenase